MQKKIAFGLLAFSLLIGCEIQREEPLVKVKLVKIVTESAWWNCGSDGYSIVEKANLERKLICGQYGEVDHIMIISPSLFVD